MKYGYEFYTKLEAAAIALCLMGIGAALVAMVAL